MIADLSTSGVSVRHSCAVLAVSHSGFYEWQSRAPSPRTIRHAWLTDVIAQVHHDSRGVYGAPRVHAELVQGRGIVIGTTR